MDQSSFYVTFAALLFSIGVLGVLIRRNLIVVFMCIELMLNAVNLTFVALASRFQSVDAQLYVFFVMAVAAAEAAVGLAIIISVFRNYYSVEASDAQALQG